MILPFKSVKNFIFDLDGTVWTFKDLYPGTEGILDRIRKKEKNIYFITNNTLLSREETASKLTKLGIRTKNEQVFTAGYTAARYFESKGITDVFVIGEHGLLADLEEEGVNARDDADHVLIAIDRNFNYMKLKKAADLVNRGAELYCTGISKFLRIGGDLYPGEAPIIKALETLTGKMPIHLGKPSDVFKSRISEDITLFPEDTLLLGDDLKEDMIFANKCGFKSAIVLTGNTSREQAEAAKGLEKPGTIIRDLKELVAFY